MSEEWGQRFPETVWTRIKQASEDRTTALHFFIRWYQEPVRRYLVGRGVSEKDAEDVVQEIFIWIFERRLLESADKNKGRFRCFLR